MQEWHADFTNYRALIHGAEVPLGRGLKRASVMAVGLVTLRYQPEAAQAFWGELAHDSTRGYDPRRKLCNFLLAGARQDRARSNAIVSRYAAYAWNRFATGASLKMWRPQEPTEPIFIAGTPYTGEEKVKV